MSTDARSEFRNLVLAVLAAALVGALLVYPGVALGDAATRSAEPVQYRGPSHEVPSGVARDPGEIPEVPSNARAPEAWARWEFWFEYQKDALIREAMKRPPAAVSGGPVLEPAGPSFDAPTEEDLADRILPALREALADPSRPVAHAAALALGNAGDLRSLPALVALLREGADPERRVAALALGFLGSRDAMDPLAGALGADPDLRVRAHAALALGLVGDAEAAPVLRDALARSLRSTGSDHRELRVAIVSGLGLLRDRASAPLLQKVLRNGDDRLRAHAATALGRLGDPAVLPPLVAALREESNHAVRRSAVAALGAFGDPDTVALLRATLEGDPDDIVRGVAAVSLARAAGRRAVEPLAAHTTIRHPRSLRGYAAFALGLTGSPREAGPTLRGLLDLKGDDSVRAAAAVALGMLGDRTALERMREIAGDRAASPELRGYALLGAALTGEPTVAEPIRDALSKEAQPERHRGAALAAGARPFPGSAALLVRMLFGGEDPTVRGAAILGLGLSPDRGVVPLLADMAVDREGTPAMQRLEAVTALGQVARRGELPPVARVAEGLNYRALTPSLDGATRVF